MTACRGQYRDRYYRRPPRNAPHMSHLQEARDIARFVLRRLREDALAQVAGSLTLSTLFALVPLATIVVTVFSVLPVSTQLMQSFNAFVVSTFVPGAATRLIAGYTQQFAENASRLTALGIALFTVTAVMVMGTIDRAFNRIWRVRRPPPVMRRLPVYWAVLTIGPLLLAAAVTLGYALLTASLGLIDDPGPSRAMTHVLSTVLTGTALFLLYRAVPNRRVASTDALIGAFVAGGAFEFLRALFGGTLVAFGNYKLIYGAFAGFPVFLLWVFLSWLVVLAGAVVTAALPQVRTGAWARHRVPGGKYLEALVLLRALRQRHVAGGDATLAVLAREARLTWEDTEDLLLRMADRGWAARVGRDGWVLARDARHIGLAEVFREFLFREQELAPQAARLGLEGMPWQADHAIAEGMTLERWCQHAPHPEALLLARS